MGNSFCNDKTLDDDDFVNRPRKPMTNEELIRLNGKSYH